MDIKFERGGKLPKKCSKLLKSASFGSNYHVEKKKTVKDSSKRELNEKKKKELNENGFEIRSAKQLTLNTLVPDMLLMAIVKSIHHTHLLLSLPGRLVGKVPITNISNSYSNAIKTALEDEHGDEDLSEKPKSLSEMFEVGQVLYTKVLDKCHGEKQEILLSLLPSDINNEIDETMLQDGNVILAAVQEIEDHGYFLETGINNIRSFLPKKNSKMDLNIGELIFCRVEKYSKSIVTFSAFKKNDSLKIDTADVPNMKTLLPGTVVTFTVVQVLKNGLEGLLFDGSITAYVNEMHIPTKISNDPKIIGKQVNARILFVMPLSNQLFVTLHPDNSSIEKKKFIHYGEIVQNAKVIKHTNNGVLLKLNGNDKGFLPRKTIASNFKDNFDIDSAMLKFSPNSMHTVRVMNYNEFENCYLCTNKEKMLNEKFFGTYDLHIGQIVQAKIVEKLIDGLRMLIGNIHAFLKGVYYHNITKCELGSDIRVRVVEIDHNSKTVQVTNLKGFLKDDCRILDSKESIKINESYTGVVLKDNPRSYTVLFFNHFKGFLPKNEDIETEMMNFGGLKVGSVKLFEIAGVNKDRIDLRISKKIDTNQIGRVFQCKVKAILPGNGLQVYIDELKCYGKVPINLLSESLHLNEHILSVITENSQLEVVSMGNNIYSRRDVKYFKSDEAITDFNDVQPNSILRCFVKSTDMTNVELECPLKNFKNTIKLNKTSFDNGENIALCPGEIVYVNVIAKSENYINSLYVTPALHKVWISSEASLDMLENYLNDISFIMNSMTDKPIGKYSIGQRISGTIKNVIGKNVVIEVEDNIFAQGTVENVHTSKIGSQLKQAVIVWIDPVQQILYLATKDKTINEISIDQDTNDNHIIEKKYKATVVYYNEYVTVCSIRSSKASSLIYVPSKQHYNDFSPLGRAIGNATSKLIVKRINNKKFLGIFAQDSKVFQKLEKLKTKLNDKLMKRKFSEKSIEQESVEIKRPKVILEDSSDDNQSIHENETTDNDFSKDSNLKKNILGKKEKVKKVVGSISRMTKNSINIKKNKAFLNKDTLLDENIVNLTSYKQLKDGKVSSHIGQKQKKIVKKSMIGKKSRRSIKKK